MRWYWYVGLGLAGLAFLGSEEEKSGPKSISLAPITELSKPAETAKGQEAKVPELGLKKSPVKRENPSVKPKSLFVTGNSVNIRSGPGVKFKILGKQYKGDPVTKVGQVGNWTKISTSSGSAWISTNYVGDKVPQVTKPVNRAHPKRTIATPSSRDVLAAKKAIIRQSIAQYPGSCPCPYNRDRGGRRCGGRSAWSKPGGYSPICYESDVSASRLKTYFARKRGAVN